MLYQTCIFVSLLLTLDVAPAVEFRQWTDASGTFKVEAAFLAVEGLAVKLQKTNGNTILVPLARLSKEDREYAEQRALQGYIGIHGRLVTEAVLGFWRDEKYPAPPVRIGVVITYVMPGSPAAKAGVRLMDIFHSGDRQRITTVEEYIQWSRNLVVGKVTHIEVATIWDERGQRIRRWQRRKLKVIPGPAAKYRWTPDRCPLRLVSAKLSKNVIGEPVAELYVLNMSPDKTAAYTVRIQCFNRFDEEVTGLFGVSNTKRGISQTTISSGSLEESSWVLHFHETTAKVKFFLERVRYENSGEWKPKKGEYIVVVGETGE